MVDSPPYLHPGCPRPRGPEDLYVSRPPWDIGRPQSAFVALAEEGAIREFWTLAVAPVSTCCCVPAGALMPPALTWRLMRFAPPRTRHASEG